MSPPNLDVSGFTCPVTRAASEHVLLAHGGGGKAMADLIHGLFLPAFKNDILSQLEDQAIFQLTGGSSPRIAFTTDSYIVRPLFFPGGDIGQLAIHGTVNDLAVGGAIPKVLSAAFILEEGTPLETLGRVVKSMAEACLESKVMLVTGDTKVVDRGKGDQIFITTSGIGLVPAGRALSVRNIQPGDKVLISGTIGDHGIAVMSVRDGLEFETDLASDTAPLSELVETMLATCSEIRWMRDPTRGGLSSVLNEAATTAGVGVRVEENALPIRPEVRAACEILGLDPMYVANEGKIVAVVPATDAANLLASMRRHPLGKNAAIIGEILAENRRLVTIKSLLGGERIVPMLSGEQLPRIC